MEDKIIDVQQESNLSRRAVAGEVLSMQGEIDPVKLMEVAAKRVEFFDAVTKLSLKRTSVHDWTDQQGKPYLQATGAEKLMALWGIYIKDTKITVHMDLENGLPTYEVTGRVGSRTLGTEIDVIAGRSANDPFFSNQSKLDLLDVRKAAYSNFIVNGVTRLIGMRGLTWDDVKRATSGTVTDQTATGKVQYKTSAGQTAAPQASPQAGDTTRTGGESPSPANPSHQSNGPVISEAQAKRMYAIAKHSGWQDSEIKDFLLREYGIEHSRDVKRADYEAICETLQSGSSH